MAAFSGYGQICPMAKAAEVLGERWTLLILRELAQGSHRFGELKRGIPMISPGMLSQRLRELEDARVIAKKVARSSREAGRGSVTYTLTASGRDATEVMLALATWGKRWALAELSREDMEPSYLMWLAHRTLRTESFGPERVVITYELEDAPAGRRRWWLVIERGEVELCFKHPGFPSDLTVFTRLRPMAELLLGRLAPRAALQKRAVRLEGSRVLARSFGTWCPRSDEREVSRE